MNGQDVQKRRRAVKFSRIPKPLSSSDHDGTFVGAPPQHVDSKVRRMHRESYLQYAVRVGASRARKALTVIVCFVATCPMANGATPLKDPLNFFSENIGALGFLTFSPRCAEWRRGHPSACSVKARPSPTKNVGLTTSKRALSTVDSKAQEGGI